MELEQLEALALSESRADALATLLPGTPEYDYWRGVHLQQVGLLAEADALLFRWQEKHGDERPLRDKLARRQLLLRAGVDLDKEVDALRRGVGASLEDQAESVAAAQHYPTKLEPRHLDGAALVREGLARDHSLSALTPEALPQVLAGWRELSAPLRRGLLAKLMRADLPGTLELAAKDLTDRGIETFSTYIVHRQLTLKQLLALAEQLPALQQLPQWVYAVLARLAPPAHSPWRTEPAVREEHLEHLWRFVSALAPAFNSLKALVLYHRLALGRQTGRLDRALFLAYLALPRASSYSEHRGAATTPAEQWVNLGGAPAEVLGLDPVRDDEPLVRAYLAHFLADEDGSAFAPFLRAEWLNEQLASTRLLAGAPEVERWTAMLGPTRLAALRERVELELTPRNPERLGAHEPVVLELEYKNVPRLVVKVFRVNVLAYFLSRGDEPGTELDLDGMVASDERVVPTEASPMRRVRAEIALEGCAGPGTYVVELLGNGRSSRALLRKGSLRYSQRVSAAGLALRVFDDAGQPLDDARLWMSGREYAARDGELVLPFASKPGPVKVLLVCGALAQCETLALPEEQYAFRAGLALEREALVPGQTAKLLLRPTLTVAGAPAPVALLEEPSAELTLTDRKGTVSSRTMPLALLDDAETVLEFAVPEDAASLAVVVRARVRSVVTRQHVELSDIASAQLNGVHAEARVESLFLSRSAQGYALHVLGRTGEPVAGRAVNLLLRHRQVVFDRGVTLETDAAGRIELGPLDEASELGATLPSGAQQRWTLRALVDAPARFHAVSGKRFALPAPPGLDAASLASAVSLLEYRGSMPAHDLSSAVALEQGALVLGPLAAGEYRLTCVGLRAPCSITVTPEGSVSHGWHLADTRLHELSAPAPLLRGMRIEGDSLRIQLSGPGPRTRVHVVGTRYVADGLFGAGLASAPRTPARSTLAAVRSHYLSGRELGDEYRYVLERRTAKRRPGSLLEKPSLLLNPWALRTTSTDTQSAKEGTAYESRLALGSFARRAGERLEALAQANAQAAASFDFLPTSTPVLANLRPDAEGVVLVPLALLGASWLASVTVVDPALTTYGELPLPEAPARFRELRLRTALDPAKHFAEDRALYEAPAGTTLAVDDVRTERLELMDTLARAHQLLLSLGNNPTLREFAFVATWGSLDEAAKREKYARYACHELHLFLHEKDPDFFARVVRPFLAHKLQKRFVDHWLLGNDLVAFTEPWAFGQLNALERILLARRVPEVREAVSRFLADAVALQRRDPEAEGRVVDTLLGSAALEEAPANAPFAEITDDDVDHLFEDAPAPQAASPAPAPAPAMPRSMSFGAPGFGPPPAAPPVDEPRIRTADPFEAEPELSRGAEESFTRDLRTREQAAQLYRGADTTQELAETGWWRRRVSDESPGLIAPNGLWRALATHAEGPFLSTHLGECATGFASSLCALAFLALPFTAAAHELTRDDARLTVVVHSHALAARTRLREVPARDTPPTLLVGQSYVRDDDRWEQHEGEQREKYLTGELLTGVVYRCLVVLTNPTSKSQKLAVLLQVPRGAMPVASGFLQRTVHLSLSAYGTHALEYAFYFPQPGTWTHFPAHATHQGALLASAPARTLTVVREPTALDQGSWSHVSQRGSTDEVLTFLRGANLGEVSLARIAWRMRERDAFERVLALLTERGVYDDRLWAYGLHHCDAARVAQWLRHHDEFLAPAGPVLEGGLVPLEPLARNYYEHLEYAPLVNARAHQLGSKRAVLNSALATQYRAFLDVLAHRATPTDDDRLAAAHYLFCMDRLDEALAQLERVAPERVSARMPYDYLAAYAACLRGELALARALITPWLELPVARWRQRFTSLAAMLSEAEGAAPAALVPAQETERRDAQMDTLAAQQPALELSVEHGALVLQHRNLARCELRFYTMELELLFSRRPFVQGDVERFSWIEPNHRETLELGAAGSHTLAMPEAMKGKNVVVEAVAAGLRKAVAHYSHTLAVELVHAFGQVRVLHAATQRPLPATYVKVYARQRGGGVTFYKDGYTDLRGRFDYATLSTDDLERVERFALLVVSDDAGSTVLEAPPPQR